MPGTAGNGESASRYVEVERKFDVDGAAVPPSFSDMAGVSGVTIDRLAPRSLDSVYFDTPAHDLAVRHITLRRRTGGTDAGWHLKLPAGPDARTEVRAPLNGSVPDELRDLVLAVVRDRPLVPVARIATAREVRLLRDADGAALAEFCDDHVTASATGAPEQRWREWELELVGGADPAAGLLDRLSAAVYASGATPAIHRSKLARALGATPPGALSHPDPVQRAVAEQVDQLLVWDRAVRVDADDSVHQMRVAIRKIRSLLQVSGPSGPSSHVIGELRWLAGLLGVARDAEVLAQRYRQELNRLPPQLVRGRPAERLVDTNVHHYQDAWREALVAMRSSRYLRLLDDLDEIIDRPTDQPAVEAPATVDAAYRRLDKAAQAAARAAGEPGRDEALHRIRKAAKRLRYTAAATGAAQVTARAKAIQTLLGDHQDSVVSRAHLLQQATAAHAAGEDTFTYGLLYQQETDLAERRRAQLDHALAELADTVGGRGEQGGRVGL